MSITNRQIIDFSILYNRHKNKIYNYVLKMINNKMVAEDIVHNVFLKLFENIDSIKNSEKISFWIFTTARNEIYTYLRGKRWKKDQFNVYDVDEIEKIYPENLEEIFELKEMGELIKKELANLSPEQKEIFIMREYGGLSYNEISEVTGIDEKKIKDRLYKIRQKLIHNISKIIE